MNQFWVDAADTVWYVDAGTAMLYLASHDSVKLAGPRRFVCAASTGCAIVAPRLALPPGTGLLCCVAPDARLRHDSLHSLDTLDPAKMAMIEDWMKKVLRELDPNAAWLETRRSVTRLRTTTVPQNTRIFNSRLQTFSEMAVSLTHARSLAADEREMRRLILEQRKDSQQFASAMGEISKGAVADDEFGMSGPSDNDGEGLLAACRFLEASRKVRFVSSRSSEVDALKDSESVEMLAESSGVRARQVLLNGKWWSEEGGDLLARLSENEGQPGATRHWVALLPHAVSGYQLYSARPMDGIASGDTVSEAIANRLAPFAYTFYRTFPKEKLSALDVIRFGLKGKVADIGILLLASVLAGALSLFVPVVSGKIIDQVIPSRDELQLWQYVAGLFVAGISVLVFDSLRTLAVLRIEARAGISVQAAILDRIVSLPVTFFRRFASGDLAVRMAAVNSIQHAVTGSTIGTILTSIFLAGNFVLMLWYSAKLTIIAFLFVALLFLVSSIIGFARLRLSRTIEDLGGKIESMVFEYLSGISKIRSSASEQRAFVNWMGKFLHLRRLHVRSESLANAESLVLNILMPAMLLFVYFSAIQAGQDGTGNDQLHRFSTGDFIAFNAALFSLVGGLYGLMSTVIDLVQLLPVWERARPIVETLPEAAGKRNERHDPLGGIEVINLGFRYADGPKVLDEVNFTVAPGTFVAVVGASGSGKSTLIRLLLGFEQPAAGSICYDGHDMAGLDTRILRSRIGTVLQGGQLWQGDLYANIAGASNLPVEYVWEAARIAGIKEDIEAMPMGLYTAVGDGDSTLSGGQRQRILIARAVVNQPRILLMDEATAALDNETQAAVQEAISILDCTRIVIAHRLSTIRNADSIVVLDQGKLVEQGTFEQLAANKGAFAALLNRQIA